MANEIYQKRGTAIVWTDSGGDEELDIGGLAADGTLGGSYYDRGDLSSTPAPDEYEWEMIIDGFDTTPVVGETVDLYFAQSNDTTEFDGQPTSLPTDTVDTATGPTTSMLPNMMYAGSCVVHSTTAADELIARGTVRFTSRYFFPVVHNNTADALLSTADAHKVTLTPVYYQGQ
jgi:hypothetical protein